MPLGSIWSIQDEAGGLWKGADGGYVMGVRLRKEVVGKSGRAHCARRRAEAALPLVPTGLHWLMPARTDVHKCEPGDC